MKVHLRESEARRLPRDVRPMSLKLLLSFSLRALIRSWSCGPRCAIVSGGNLADNYIDSEIEARHLSIVGASTQKFAIGCDNDATFPLCLGIGSCTFLLLRVPMCIRDLSDGTPRRPPLSSLSSAHLLGPQPPQKGAWGGSMKTLHQCLVHHRSPQLYSPRGPHECYTVLFNTGSRRLGYGAWRSRLFHRYFAVREPSSFAS